MPGCSRGTLLYANKNIVDLLLTLVVVVALSFRRETRAHYVIKNTRTAITYVGTYVYLVMDGGVRGPWSVVSILMQMRVGKGTKKDLERTKKDLERQGPGAIIPIGFNAILMQFQLFSTFACFGFCTTTFPLWLTDR